MDKDEVREVIRKLDSMEDNVKEMSDAVFGDKRGVADGLIKDMRHVRDFILKWDKREYAWKVIIAILGSNLLLTILGFVFTLIVGGG